MLDVHKHIHELKSQISRDSSSRKPQPFDAIAPVAKTISDQSWLICFDEFQVSLLLLVIYNVDFMIL